MASAAAPELAFAAVAPPPPAAIAASRPCGSGEDAASRSAYDEQATIDRRYRSAVLVLYYVLYGRFYTSAQSPYNRKVRRKAQRVLCSHSLQPDKTTLESLPSPTLTRWCADMVTSKQAAGRW